MKNDQTKDDCNTELSVLDRLVTHEINSLQHKAGKKKRVRSVQKNKPRRSENVIFKDRWLDDVREESNTTKSQEINGSDDYDDTDVNEFDGQMVQVGDQQLDSAPNTELFTEEEQDFIQQTTDWLGSRANKDLIVSRIWDLVTESVPESFYSVKDAANTISGEADIMDDIGEEPSKPSNSKQD